MANVEIDVHGIVGMIGGGSKGTVTVNGNKIDHVMGFRCEADSSSVPTVELTVNAYPESILKMDNADIYITFEPRSLQDAAKVLKYEFEKKGDWYNALVQTIHKHIDECTPMNVPTRFCTELADKIIGGW